MSTTGDSRRHWKPCWEGMCWPSSPLADTTPGNQRLQGLGIVGQNGFKPESACKRVLTEYAFASSTSPGKDPYHRSTFCACLLRAFQLRGIDFDCEACLEELSVGRIATFMSLAHHALLRRSMKLETQGTQDSIGVEQAKLMRKIESWQSVFRPDVSQLSFPSEEQ